MGDIATLLIGGYLAIAFVLSVLACAYSGWVGEHDPGGLIALAFIWGFILIIGVICAPLWLAYRAGDFARAALTSDKDT